jgi:alpha-galactosidase
VKELELSQPIDERAIHLFSKSSSLVLDTTDQKLSILYWGSALKDPISSIQNLELLRDSFSFNELDDPKNSGYLRENSQGWLGTSAIQGHHAGLNFSTSFKIFKQHVSTSQAKFELIDEIAKLIVNIEMEVDPSGLLLVTSSITNNSETAYNLNSFSSWMPLPNRASEIMSFTGRWVKERQMQRNPISVGTFARESREGRSGHDATITMLALSENCTFQNGEVWSCALAWSGNTKHVIEKLPTGKQSIGAEELLLPGEIVLAQNQTYNSPTVVFGYSENGIDGISNAHYRWLRSRESHPTTRKPRPITLNVWEAVYFDHDLNKLTELATVANSIGVERFVLDDGWFHQRRDDHAGLGDWWVDPNVWPAGLGELIKTVKSLDMEFGLWFEPEMVNPNSDLYRNHPDWILKVADRIPPEQRHQLVLNLANPEVYQYLLQKISDLLNEYPIDYIKWDHNRVLIEPGYHDKAVVHLQTKALYNLIDQLKNLFPGLEIESCASGGARIDLGAALHFDRFWTSDCNEALERNYIQRWTGIVIPPELLGTHVGPPKSHTTGRTHNLPFRAVTAFFGHAGIEWDITKASATELDSLKNWISYHKENRDLLHSGNVVRVNQPDDAIWVHGVVNDEKTKAIFSVSHLKAINSSKPANIQLAGLSPSFNYLVKMVEPAGSADTIQSAEPTWRDGAVLSGDLIMNFGLRPAKLQPENAYLIELVKFN